jgi:hypothetical protein
MMDWRAVVRYLQTYSAETFKESSALVEEGSLETARARAVSAEIAYLLSNAIREGLKNERTSA